MPEVVGVQVMVTALPAWIVPPVGEVIGLGDCATASAAKAEMRIAKNFMVVDVLADGLPEGRTRGRECDRSRVCFEE